MDTQRLSWRWAQAKPGANASQHWDLRTVSLSRDLKDAEKPGLCVVRWATRCLLVIASSMSPWTHSALTEILLGYSRRFEKATLTSRREALTYTKRFPKNLSPTSILSSII